HRPVLAAGPRLLRPAARADRPGDAKAGQEGDGRRRPGPVDGGKPVSAAHQPGDGPACLSSCHIRARHYATGEAVDVRCNGGVIRSVGPPSAAVPDVTAAWVAPALFDLQINGCDGRNFSSERLTVDDVRHVAGACRRHGLGGLCPTLVTNSFAALAHGMATVREACEADAGVARMAPAIHLEGPYISAEDGPRGAPRGARARPRDGDELRRLQAAAGGRIRLVTLAPEHDGAQRFIERLAGAGVVVALGHTAATPARIRDAVRAGARLSTHLG